MRKKGWASLILLIILAAPLPGGAAEDVRIKTTGFNPRLPSNPSRIPGRSSVRSRGRTATPAVAAAAAPQAAALPSAPAEPDKTSPWQPVSKAQTSGELSRAQQAHIEALIARVNGRTPRSKELTQLHRPHLSDPRTVQGFRKQWKEMVYPIVSDRAKGSKIWDVDGNEYIDLVNGYGVTLFGHSPDFILDAVREQLEKTVAIGPQTELAGEVAKLVCEMTGMERAAFCNTGSEAVLAAIRMARTVTGKTKLATFAGHYHGIFDEVLVKGMGTGAERRPVPTAPGIPPSKGRSGLDALTRESLQCTQVNRDPANDDVWNSFGIHSGLPSSM